MLLGIFVSLCSVLTPMSLYHACRKLSLSKIGAAIAVLRSRLFAPVVITMTLAKTLKNPLNMKGNGSQGRSLVFASIIMKTLDLLRGTVNVIARIQELSLELISHNGRIAVFSISGVAKKAGGGNSPQFLVLEGRYFFITTPPAAALAA